MKTNKLALSFSVLSLLTLVSCSHNKEEPIDTQYQLYTVQPWYSEQKEKGADPKIPFPEGVTNQAEIITKAAEKVASNLNNCTYGDAYCSKDEVITANVLKKIKQNTFAIFQGHGSFVSGGVGPCIWNGNPWDDAKLNDPDFKKEVDEKRIVKDEYQEVLTSKYIDYYCEDMTGSIIYLGQCLCGKSDQLANAFLRKGAVAVVANTDAVQVPYGNIMQYNTVTLMSTINPKTNNYYTLAEALLTSKEKYGYDDSFLAQYANGACPVIYGNGSIRLKENEAS